MKANKQNEEIGISFLGFKLRSVNPSPEGIKIIKMVLLFLLLMVILLKVL